MNPDRQLNGLEAESMAFRARRARAKVPFAAGEHLVIVGCGPVAARLVDDLLPMVQAGRLRVTVIGAEEHLAYNRILVGEYAVGRVSREALTIADLDAWRRAGIQLLLGSEVTGLDRTRRRVTVRRNPAGALAGGSATLPGGAPTSGASAPYATGVDGDGATAVELTWDRLVLATGARPVRPNLRGMDPSPDGADLPDGVVALRCLEDAERVRAVVDNGGEVVVLGGGVLGVEAALAAAETTGRATLVHAGTHPMERVLSETTAQLVTGRLNEAGVRCVSARAVGVTVDDDGRFTALEAANQAPVTGDLLVLSCGVQARTALAERAGLRTRHGIVVDHELQADVEGRVFALGDCAEVLCRDPACEPCVRRATGELPSAPAGMIAPGWRQAEYLAARFQAELGPDPSEGQGSPLVEPLPAHEPSLLRLKARTIDLVVLEWGEGAATTARGIRFTDDALHQDLHAELEPDGRLRRAVVLGRPRALAYLSSALESGRTLRGDLTYLLSLDSDWAAPESETTGPESVVCRCAGVTRAALETVIDEGADSTEAVSAATRACTGCGTCRPEIQALLAQRVKRLTVPGAV